MDHRRWLWCTCIVVLLSGTYSGQVEAKKAESTEFIKGIDYGKRFLRPKSEKGKKYRLGLNLMHETWGPWNAYYAPYEYVMLLTREWLESRGNPWSHTKDTHLMEAGLTSVTYKDAVKVCREWGVCGDPCGDPRLAIAISSYRKYRAHTEMLHGTNEDGEPTFWSEWLPQQAEDNYFEARCIMGLCGSANCAKVRKAFKTAEANAKVISRRGKKDDLMHAWWFVLNWLRDQKQGMIEFLFAPLPSGMTYWRFGTKWGRQIAGHEMRSEFFEPHSDGSKNYCWPPDGKPYFPHRPETGPDGVIVMVPDFPEPLYPWPCGKDGKVKVPKKSEWRDRCTFYGDKKAWKKVWHAPKPNDRWRKGGFKYHPVTGAPIKVKKGQKKYPTEADWRAAYDKWFDDQQALGILPSDEEYKALPAFMEDLGCIYKNPVAE